jgi:glucokinase
VQTILLADIGGTTIRLAILGLVANEAEHIQSFACADHASLEIAIRHYLDSLPAALQSPQKFVLAVPGPVHTEPVTLVNNPWLVSRDALGKICGSEIVLLNDFSAQAWAISRFAAEDLINVRDVAASTAAPRVILGPGTGLGVSVLLPGQSVLESEAGHIAFAPRSTLQDNVLSILRQRHSHVSNESLLSGPGLENLHTALCRLQGQTSELSARQISQQARDGDTACLATVHEFLKILAAVSGDMALTYAATGGVFLSGGLLAGLLPCLDRAEFLRNFDDKGGFQGYCQAIAVRIVTHPYPGLVGAANFAGAHPGD